MSGQHAADAELDEALALVNEDRARGEAGLARPHSATAAGAPGAPGTSGTSSAPGAPNAPSAPGPPGTQPPAPVTQRQRPAAQAKPSDDGLHSPGRRPEASGVQPGGPAPEGSAPEGPTPKAPTPEGPAPAATHTHTTPWSQARSTARRAGASAAAEAAKALQDATRQASPRTPTAAPAGTRTPTDTPSPVGTPTSLPQTLGRTLLTPLTALTDLPSFDTSAMDGWAVAGPGPWVLLPDGILAGQDSPQPLGDGEAVRIATGARIPRDTTAVIRSEHGHVDDKGHLHAQREVVPGQDIRPRGQECRAGDQLLPPGALVTPAVLGLAAAAGYDALHVAARPRVEVLVLGDELLTEGLPQEGRIRDALGPMLPPWLRALGAEVTAVRRLGDDAEALYEALATSTADLLVTTGGTASGPVDHVHPTLRRLGAELLVDGVAVRPGHPMLLARLPRTTPGTAPGAAAVGRGERHLVGLPGNPLAAVSGLLTLAEPLLRGLAGRPAPEPYAAPLRDDVHGHPHDTRLVPVTLRGEYAVPLHYNGPAMLRGIAVADGLAVVPAGGGRKGQELEILDLPWAEPGGQYGELGGSGLDSGACFT
ncbi:hypothetical protein GCM10010252_21630 [Streptomyces aureoverticillatus]|nr:hypothetical protein GCM10010252_21630 [Streptomyces aureoverticillatus]